MNTRINMHQVLPAGYNALLSFSKFISGTSLTTTHKNLISIRASQINGCAFCLDMHTKEARAAGETEQRIYSLNAWRETSWFTEEEKAILALTEEVTLISHHVTDETYNKAATVLSPEYLAETIMAIIAINSWNRVAITCRFIPQ